MFDKVKDLLETAVDNYVGQYKCHPLARTISDPDATVLDLPPYQQLTRYSCAYVTGLIVLRYFFPKKSDKRFWNRVDPYPNGFDQKRLVRALEDSGIKVRRHRKLTFDAIARAIDADQPILVTLDRGETDHWVVIGGYAQKPKRVYLFNLSWKHRPPYGMRWKTFRENWAPPGLGLLCSPARKA